jgi:hypothetical protein
MDHNQWCYELQHLYAGSQKRMMCINPVKLSFNIEFIAEINELISIQQYGMHPRTVITQQESETPGMKYANVLMKTFQMKRWQ